MGFYLKKLYSIACLTPISPILTPILDQRGTVTFKLKGSSPTNKILSALYKADMNAPNGTGVGAVLIRDTQGLSVFAGPQAWIASMPKTSLGKKLGDVEWKLRVASLEGFVG
ncbi:MAG: DUF3277 family protein [Methylococcaceae bacterium]|nr:DUF3277 family protein [Methylococcaceae bacterium]